MPRHPAISRNLPGISCLGGTMGYGVYSEASQRFSLEWFNRIMRNQAVLPARLRGGVDWIEEGPEDMDTEEEEPDELSSSELYHDHCLVRTKDDETLEYVTALIHKICLPPKDPQTRRDLLSVTNILYYLLALATHASKSKSYPLDLQEKGAVTYTDTRGTHT
eukprot:761469-Hanusia_phi.AAC.2